MTNKHIIIGIVLIIAAIIIYKMFKSPCSGNGSVDVAASCYKQLNSFIINNPTMTGADIKNNFMENVNCSKL